MKFESRWWFAVPLLLVVALGWALWYGRAANQPVPTSNVQPPAVTDTPQAEPSIEPSTTPVAASAAAAGEPCTTPFTRLLEKEASLSSRGIILSMGYAADEPSVRMPPPCSGITAQDFFALTPHGVEPLRGDVARAVSTVPWGCGEDVPAIQLASQKPIEKGNLPVALGAAAATLLQWAPAKPVEGSADCPAPQAEFTRESQQLFEFAGREGRWVLETWKLAADPPAAEANDEESYRRVAFIDAWNRIGTDGTCTTGATSERNVEGVPVRNKPPLHNVYGLLEFADSPSEQRAWFLFDSPGYEGDGVSAVPFEQRSGRVLLESADTNVYSGC